MTEPLLLAPYFAELERVSPLRWTGEVTEVAGLLVESRGSRRGDRRFLRGHDRPPAAASAPR